MVARHLDCASPDLGELTNAPVERLELYARQRKRVRPDVNESYVEQRQTDVAIERAAVLPQVGYKARTLERRGACIADAQITEAWWIEFRGTEAHARPTEQHDRDLQRSRSALWDAQPEPVRSCSLGFV
jgi:hypothetical protein